MSPTPPRSPDHSAAAGPLVRCPACNEQCRFHPSNPWRPFCSARCKGVDLGAWASEGYRVPAAPPVEDDEFGPLTP
ncbi:MAG: DNA gyrase inhibitor YacG [Leptothrix sp. (in: b-proteobacteria)]